MVAWKMKTAKFFIADFGCMEKQKNCITSITFTFMLALLWITLNQRLDFVNANKTFAKHSFVKYSDIQRRKRV